MSDFYRVKICFDGYDNQFLSTDTYDGARARELAERIADHLPTQAWVEVEYIMDAETVFGRLEKSTPTGGGAP